MRAYFIHRLTRIVTNFCAYCSFKLIQVQAWQQSVWSDREKQLELARTAGKGLLVCFLLAVTWLLFSYLPVRSADWVDTFKPAALNWQQPYFKPGVIFNPPWIFPLLYPLARLPAPFDTGLLSLVSVAAVALYVKSIKKTLFVALSAPMAILMSLGQLDALLLLGLMLPHGFGIPLLLVKPQGVFLTLVPRLNRRSILLTALIAAGSIVIWGAWWLKITPANLNFGQNISLFPYTVVVGLGLGYLGLRRKSDALLCAASLCFAPYFMPHSLLPVVAAIVRETDDWRWWTATVIGSWLYVAGMKGFLW